MTESAESVFPSWRSLTLYQKRAARRRISKLLRAGATNREIAQCVQLNEHTVKYVIGQLPRSKKPKHRHRRGRQGQGFWADLNYPRTAKIVQLMQERATFVQIAQAIGVSAARAHEIVQRMKEFHRPAVFRPPQALFNLGEVAQRCGISPKYVIPLCLEAKITYKRQGKGQTNEEYIFSLADLRALKQALRKKRVKTCVICKRKFKDTPPFFIRVICPRKRCQRAYYRSRQSK